MSKMGEWALEVLQEEDRNRELDYQYEQYEAEMKWFEEHPFLETYSIFKEMLMHLKLMVNKPVDKFDSEMMCKMAYVHAVTLFEAMVGDVLKATILAYPTLMQKMVKKLGEDKSNKFHISEIAELGLNGIILGILNQQIYHNPVTVKKYLNLITGKVLRDTYMAGMQEIADRRHDFVHRNGKTLQGVELNIDPASIISAVEVIQNFAQDIFEILDRAMKDESGIHII
ncbi:MULTISPECIES: HEPN domain-containing protein [Pseudomonas syringae group genomosp. 2]|uniref:RiboL-PSP-HEPN domain-containing protein n=1 Tax=Pseudomonas savastanoi TaxID=29438 RepID=A0AAW3M823_PSESS|nr:MULTISPECIES: HEPN domain-containing protein [Pseudomonas syringae group genomosp. 2]KIY17082.1 hypothetical protein RD00_19235 [Pseudomonas amygdali pv. tabaci]KTC62437.1 hypothetical protein AO287_26610 [Pseudomonas savastanoi]RMM78985.1 hypothetical protein ALQ75_03272 [Pseudomonas savastanoi pv. glycinea]RMM98934.1 hypothetical protein ALQ68_01691 [Pseudomonas savastanoi pv. glycinea]RMP90683.1 hypothetical protein ALQ13_02680 [Pseudomonas savastanoi pv. glycinea]